MVMQDFSPYVPQVKFELIPIKNLFSDQDYQRNLSKQHVERAAKNFDLCQINPVKVSRRDGINYVFNGQHTIEIIALVSGSRDTPVWCMVYEGLQYEHEADIFANQMKYTKPLSPYEIFMANIEAGNDKQLIIREMLGSYHLKVTPGKQVGGICAISTLETIYDKYGLQNLQRVIRLISGTWEGDVNSYSALMLSGVSRLVYTFDTELNDENFKEKLGNHSVKEVYRSARERGMGSLGCAEALLFIYNKKMKYPLDYLRLHSGKGRKKILTEFVDVEEDEDEELYFTPPFTFSSNQEEDQDTEADDPEENEPEDDDESLDEEEE